MVFVELWKVFTLSIFEGFTDMKAHPNKVRRTLFEFHQEAWFKTKTSTDRGVHLELEYFG
jgi:hypothetical protein